MRASRIKTALLTKKWTQYQLVGFNNTYQYACHHLYHRLLLPGTSKNTFFGRITVFRAPLAYE
jgi:hypothetical protein